MNTNHHFFNMEHEKNVNINNSKNRKRCVHKAIHCILFVIDLETTQMPINRLNKPWYFHTMEYYAVKSNEDWL